MLNYIWVGFFLVAFVVALVKLVFFGDTQVFTDITNGTFTSAKSAFEVSLGLTGALTLWMGVMRVGEKAGAINFLGRIVGPFFKRLFPEIPEGHPAMGNILMNFSANMLGIGNAATPLGLKAMQSMQELNANKETASNSMIMFLALNTAGFTLIPVSILAIRAQQGAADPTDVFIPIMIASFCASLIGMIIVAIKQKINLLDKVLLGWILGLSAFMIGMIYLLFHLSPERRTTVSNVESSFILFSIIVLFIAAAAIKKLNVFSLFIEGAKDGFQTVIRIIPYLVAMIVAIGIFRSSGTLNYITGAFAWCFEKMGFNTDFVSALPVAFMKPLSGSGSQGMVIDVMHANGGADSFAGKLSSVMYGSADTTLYIVALYFGSVGITKTRYAVGAGLLTDLAGIISAILVSYLFFH